MDIYDWLPIKGEFLTKKSRKEISNKIFNKRTAYREEEYAQSMFHLARQLKEGKTAKQVL